MRLLKKVLLPSILVGTSLLYAQPDPAGQSPPEDPAAAPKVERQLSVTEMITSSEELRKQVLLDLRHVLHLQSVTRKEKDVIKLTCINDKLIEMKPLANRFDLMNRELQDLLTDGSDERHALYGNVSTAADAVQKLRKEADQCAGEPELSSDTDNQFTAPDLPLDPTKGNPFEEGVEPPGYASPYS